MSARRQSAVYVISVAAELAGVHPQTLRIYERKGLVEPARTPGGSRRYSDEDLAVLRRIQELTEAGLNLAGVKRVLELEQRIGPGERRLLERLVERLPALLSHETRPALIHGDLWSGNVLATTRGPALVDPACAACDREMEFGITTLFGGFSEHFFDAYEEALPLPGGWRERNPLYQLYHLLNHHLIFGGHYGREALSLARRYA